MTKLQIATRDGDEHKPLCLQSSLSNESMAILYSNKRIVEKMMTDLNLSGDDALELFLDTKKFLFLCAKHPLGLRPTPRLDAGWHVMILFTKDYAEFCHDHFGKFVHHAPSVPSDGESEKLADFDRLRQLATEEFGPFLSDNWSLKSSPPYSTDGVSEKMADCCTGGDCSNTGNCSHCTEG